MKTGQINLNNLARNNGVYLNGNQFNEISSSIFSDLNSTLSESGFIKNQSFMKNRNLFSHSWLPTKTLV